MNKTRSIDQARSSDLRGSWDAVQRAARRARRIAAQTGTAIVVARDGKLEHVYPPFAAQGVRDESADYGNKR